MIGDMTKIENAIQDPTQFDTLFILQLIWAMAKADALGKNFPSFYEWVAELETFDISDETVGGTALEEAMDGFFVQASKRRSPNRLVEEKKENRFEIDLLVIGKQIGLSFIEMNELRVTDLLDLAKAYSGTDEQEPKEATQADIDAFYGR
ncbi:hypothetical protein P7H16_14260 [Paenibacillus larvae]|nr:hypothetical protein [Paenibacillus larvae]MDT2247853.1 hypothetical protein [Paenibacillus larvae]